MAAAQLLTIAAKYDRPQEMWDSVYTTSESWDIAMAWNRNTVLGSRRRNGKVAQCISLPNPTAFPACKENLGKMKERLEALEARQDSDKSEGLATIWNVWQHTRAHVPHPNGFGWECTAPGVVLLVRFERTVSVGLAKEWNVVLQCGLTVWLRIGIQFCSVEIRFG